MRHVKRAPEDNVRNRIKAAHGEVFSARNEIARGVIDQTCERAMLSPDVVIHVTNGFTNADITGMWHDLAAMLAHQHFGCFFANPAATATNVNFRAKL